ncbi:MAG: hypothetical protein AAGA48_23945, partial [Myxococcota bacterium]
AEEHVRRVIQDAKRERMILVSGSRLVLSDAGRSRAEAFLGADKTSRWEQIRDRRLPIVALGLDPDSGDVRRRLRHPQNFIGAICGVTFDVAERARLSVKDVRTELVWRVVKDRMADLIGPGPFPVIDPAGPVATVILASLADTRRQNIDHVMSDLAAKAIGSPSSTIKALRQRLLELGVAPSTEVINGAVMGSGGNQVDLPFSARVLALVRSMETPPFVGRVAIAQVFDAYGAKYQDGTTLEDFKQSLVKAAKSRELQLDSLELPEMMDPALRDRSMTKWNRENVHLVSSESIA